MAGAFPAHRAAGACARATSVGKLSFADAGGHDVSVPVSFKGFAQAFDALAKK